MDLFRGLDWGTYNTFQFMAKHSPGLQSYMEAGDWLGSYVGVAILLALTVLVFVRQKQWRAALAIVATFVLGIILVEGVKLATHRPRPPDAQNILASAEFSPSFPSRAVFLAAFAWLMLATALERWTRNKKYRIAIYVVAALGIVFVCVSVLWLGLHFLTDVLAGLAGGLGLALVARWAAAAPVGAEGIAP
jgi:undecaprenyl-diphosphatase